MLNFTRADISFLYPSDAGGNAFLAFYVIDGRESAPNAFTLEEAWTTTTQTGYFLFLQAPPASLPALYAALEKLRTGEHPPLPDPAHGSFAWMRYDDKSGTATVAQAIQSGSGTVPEILNDCRFGIGPYTLPLLSGMRINTGGDTFTFSYPNYPDSPAPVAAAQVRLHLSGGSQGCFTTEATIADFSDALHTGWNAALYYFTGKENAIATHRYPVFRQQQGLQVLFNIHWDPLALLDPARTYLAFEGSAFLLTENEGQFSIEPVNNTVTLDTWFRTARGEQVCVRPLATARTPAGPARLVIAALPPGSGSGFYLAPAGDFELALKATSINTVDAPPSLLCGVSGTETIGFTPFSDAAAGDTLSFFPGQPAYAPAYPLIGQNNDLTKNQLTLYSKEGLLTDLWKTSWIGFTGASGATLGYYAQPENAPGFGQDKAVGKAQADAGSAAFLQFQPLKAGSLAVKNSTDCFPLTPLACATESEDPDFITRFETQIVAPVRREAIRNFGQMSLGNADADPIWITTPQGLLAEVTGTQWTQLLLARSTDEGIQQQLSFSMLNPTLQAAFQTSELFLVVSDNTYLSGGGTSFSNVIPIEGWPFHIDVTRTQEGLFKNVLLFKFCKGTLAERIADPKLWTNAADFNGSEPSNILLLLSWLKDMINVPEDNTSYDYFRTIINDRNWNGIIALNVSIGLQDFPPELQGLLAGIDLNRFAAHHFGVNANRVAPDKNGVLAMSPQSSLFGLIDYNGEAQPQNEDQAYDFSVLKLKVLFHNSAIKSFDSRIRLTLRKVLGSAVKDGDNSVELNGVYENHSGSKSYAFNLAEQKVFTADNGVLQSLSIVKAQFSTLQKLGPTGLSANAPTGREVHSRFSFWGDLSFNDLSAENGPAFDPFSFDALRYGNLELNMDFFINNPAGKTFLLSSLNMSFDLLQSNIRAHSLYRRFPLQLQSLIIGKQEQKPADSGFLAVITPLKLGTLEKEWYGLQCNISFGSPGNLAEKTGFTASLLLAWSPGADKLSASVMLRLPGSAAGKRQLSLQGILTVGADKYLFLSYLQQKENAYLLYLKNMGLFFLGIRIPPGFGTDIVLFGNPDPGATNDTLGWYAAYNKKKKQNLLPPANVID